ncbi:helix-turn-helix domain-containing protein [soil metagenome]
MFSESVLYIGLAQSLFGAFVLATKKRVEISDKILIACLLTFAFKFMLYLMHLEHAEFFDLSFSMGLMPLTFGPYLYLYTTYLVERKARFEYKDLCHFLPFLITTIAYFAFFKEVVDFTDVNYFQNDKFLWVRVLYGFIFLTSIVAYTVFTYVKLWRFRKGIAANFSYWTRQLRLLWLNFIPGLFVLLFTLYFVTGAINAFSFKKVFDLTQLSHIGLTVIAFAISYFGLRQMSLFRPLYIHTPEGKVTETESLILQEEDGDEPEKKIKARFTDEQAQELIVKLNRHMDDEKPYLNPELTLYDLSSQLNLSKNELTDLLNNHLGKNFFAFVNEFRLKAVIRKFENPDYSHYTIIAIAYDCGFNSKSTFNSIFKQYTGQTPSDYKKAKGDILQS